MSVNVDDVRMIHDGRRNRKSVLATCPVCHSERWISIENARTQNPAGYCQAHAPRPLRSNITKTCKRCGKTLRVIPALAQRKQYCSKDCMNYIRPRPCLHCGKSFKPTRNASQFCSGQCYHQHVRLHPDKQCPTCGRVFQPTSAHTQFCSMQCRVLKGILNPNYKHGRYTVHPHPYPYGGKWPVIRRAILDRDGHQCRWPGCRKTDTLQVHHIRKFSLFATKEEANHPDNLITLCHHHHEMADT